MASARPRSRRRAPQQVAAVRRARAPTGSSTWLKRNSRDAPVYWPVPLGLIAYLLGAIGMIGSGIWLMWLISLIHWPGLRMLLTSAESLLVTAEQRREFDLDAIAVVR